MTNLKNKTWRKNRAIDWRMLCLIVALTAAIWLGPVLGKEAHPSLERAAMPASFAQLAKQASPAVVNVSTVRVINGGPQAPLPFGPDDPLRDFFERFFGDQMPKDYPQRGLGTGFIIDTEGFILTANHVVEGAEEILVTLADKRELSAKIVGRDSKTDLALIKIEAPSDITPLPLGDSAKLEIGEWVVAIGNPFGLGNTVTAGIVSAKYRQIGAGPYDNFIQTDASINPGNSGGPLLNTAGEVVGINSAIFSPGGGNIGIGFAIPINMAKDLLPQLKGGKVVRGWLGVAIQSISAELRDKLGLQDRKGALVADVTAGGPADKAGIQRGDVIVSFDGKEIRESSDLPYLVASTAIGKKVAVEVIRRGQKKSLAAKIGELQEGQEPEEVSKAEPTLGLMVDEITPELAEELGLKDTSGVIVTQVDDGSPAAEAGLKPSDVILEVDQQPMANVRQFDRKIEGYKPGDTILLLVRRQAGTIFLTLKLRSY